MNGRGYQIRIPVQLKNVWARATCMALESLNKAAKIPVTVVPTFEPRVKGNICSRVRTPTPHKGVSAEVKAEED